MVKIIKVSYPFLLLAMLFIGILCLANVALLLINYKNSQINHQLITILDRYVPKPACSINGVPVSCEEYPSARGGLNGVCPGINSNKTLEDCLMEAKR